MSFLTPYTQSLGMSTAKWMQLPSVWVPVASLTPTQDVTEELWPERRPEIATCCDPLIHVVQLGSASYIEDGHHRVARARRDGLWDIEARVLTL